MSCFTEHVHVDTLGQTVNINFPSPMVFSYIQITGQVHTPTAVPSGLYSFHTWSLHSSYYIPLVCDWTSSAKAIGRQVAWRHVSITGQAGSSVSHPLRIMRRLAAVNFLCILNAAWWHRTNPGLPRACSFPPAEGPCILSPNGCASSQNTNVQCVVIHHLWLYKFCKKILYMAFLSLPEAWTRACISIALFYFELSATFEMSGPLCLCCMLSWLQCSSCFSSCPN